MGWIKSIFSAFANWFSLEEKRLIKKAGKDEGKLEQWEKSHETNRKVNDARDDPDALERVRNKYNRDS